MKTLGAWMITPLCLLGLLLSADVSEAKAPASQPSLGLHFSNPETYLIPASTSSCQATLDGLVDGVLPQRDIEPFYLYLLNPEIRFESPTAGDVAQIERIEMKFDSPSLQGGRFTCTLDGPELAAIFAVDPKNRWNGRLNANSSLMAGSGCQVLRCGSIPVLDQIGEFQAQGEVTVFGHAENAVTGKSTPLRFSKPFQVLNVW